MPRDEIARLIDNAYRGGAAVIMPGFPFEERDCYRKGGDSLHGNFMSFFRQKSDTVSQIIDPQVRKVKDRVGGGK